MDSILREVIRDVERLEMEVDMALERLDRELAYIECKVQLLQAEFNLYKSYINPYRLLSYLVRIWARTIYCIIALT
jgi:hypothetical protein